MTKPRIVSLGEVLWDLFPSGERFGGAPANFACHASMLGGDVTMISAVGDDSRGRKSLENLGNYDVGTDLIQIVREYPTGTVGVELDDDRKPTFTIHSDSAWDHLVWNPEIESAIASADSIYFGTLGQRSSVSQETISRSLDEAKKRQIPRVVDINLRAPFFDAKLIRRSVHDASILKLSDDELSEVCRAFELDSTQSIEVVLREILESQSLDLVLMTKGGDGAVLVGPDRIVSQPGIETIVRDTVGAGDSFTAAFLVGFLADVAHRENLRNACHVAAEVCSQLGAVPNRARGHKDSN